MNDFECSKVENCFSKTAIYQYHLNFKLDLRFISYFEEVGLVKCHINLPRPYFKATLLDGVEAKGVLGDVAMRVAFPFADFERQKEWFEEFLRQSTKRYKAE